MYFVRIYGFCVYLLCVLFYIYVHMSTKFDLAEKWESCTQPTWVNSFGEFRLELEALVGVGVFSKREFIKIGNMGEIETVIILCVFLFKVVRIIACHGSPRAHTLGKRSHEARGGF